MLKTIDPILTGDLLGILMDMGHGDEIALVDANFPAACVARRLVRLPGLDGDRVAEAVLSLLPLDAFVDEPAIAMADPDGPGPVHDAFRALIEGHGGTMGTIDRFAFYDRAKAAYAVVATGERRLYGNLILKKGVLP